MASPLWLAIYKGLNACFWLRSLSGKWECLDPVRRFKHTSLVPVFVPTERPKSVRNRCVIEVLGGVFMFSLLLLDFYVGLKAFVIGLSQIPSFLF